MMVYEACGLQTLHISLVSLCFLTERKKISSCLELFLAVYSKTYCPHISQMFPINAY